MPQHILLGEPGERDHPRDGQLVGRDGPGLVDAEDVHRSGVFRRAQSRDQDAGRRQFACADGHAHRQHDRQSDGDGAKEQREQERQHVHEVNAARDREPHNDQHDDAHDDEQPADEVRDQCLRVECRSRDLHELRGASEERACAGGGDDGRRLTTTDHGRRVHDGIGALLGVLGLSGQDGLVDAERPTEQPDVRRDDVTLPDSDDVVWNEVARRQHLPLAVSKHASVHLQAAAERVHDALGSSLLHGGDDRVQREEGCRDHQVGISVQRPRQRGDRLEHPGRQAPELRQEREKGVRLLLQDLVRSILLSPSFDLFVREADVDVRGARLWCGRRCRRRAHDRSPSVVLAASSRRRWSRLESMEMTEAEAEWTR